MQAQAICLLAAQIAKGPGMVSIAGQWLNIVLEDLKLNRDLKVNRVTQSITLQPGSYGPFNLEADYLRTYDMFYSMPSAGGATASSVTIFLSPITMEQYDAEFKGPSIANYPYEFATDLSTQAQAAAAAPALPVPGSTPAGYVYTYPPSSGQLVVTHRYMVNQPDIANPQSSTTIPWFPFNKYLIHAVAAGMMGVTGDNRKAQFEAEAEAMLRPHLIMEGDEQSTVHNIKLDPRHFHSARGLKPTKASPL